MTKGVFGEKRQLLNIDSLSGDVEKAAIAYVDGLVNDHSLLSNFKVQLQYVGLMSVFDVAIADYFTPPFPF